MSTFAVLVSCCDQVPQVGWLKQQKPIVSQFWRLEVQNQGVGGVMFLLAALGRLCSGLLHRPTHTRPDMNHSFVLRVHLAYAPQPLVT